MLETGSFLNCIGIWVWKWFQIQRIIYSENFEGVGTKCTGCGQLFNGLREMCGICNSVVANIDNFLEIVVRRVIQLKGKIKPVHGEAALRLNDLGSIGAYLRY